MPDFTLFSPIRNPLFSTGRTSAMCRSTIQLDTVRTRTINNFQ
jgi:hypothetical protein